MQKIGLEKWALLQFESHFKQHLQVSRLPRHYWLYVNNRSQTDNLWDHIQAWVEGSDTGAYNLSLMECRTQRRVVNFIYQAFKARWDEEDGVAERKRKRQEEEATLVAAQGDLFTLFTGN